MKPSILQGHTRPIKAISFNSNSSIAYSASNDRTIISWDIEKKEKARIFNHAAAINAFALSSCDKYLVSGDSTGTVSIWDCEKNIILSIIDGDPTEVVKSITFTKDSKQLLISFAGRSKTAASKMSIYEFDPLIEIKEPSSKSNSFKEKNDYIPNDGLKSESIYNQESIYSNISQPNQNSAKKKKSKEIKDPYINYVPKKLQIENIKPLFEIKSKESKYNKAIFVDNDNSILVAKDNGFLELINIRNQEVIMEKKIHSEGILDIDVHPKLKFVITSSSDGYSFVVGLDTFQVYFKFHPDTPSRNLNACRLMLIENPFFSKKKVEVDELFNTGEESLEDRFVNLRKEEFLPIAIFAGGQDSKLVTTTHGNEGGFEIIVHELLFGSRLLYFQSHFGPINALGISVDKFWLASGSEDATVRLYNMDDYIRSIDK
jgi:WD40 repeat protein